MFVSLSSVSSTFSTNSINRVASVGRLARADCLDACGTVAGKVLIHDVYELGVRGAIVDAFQLVGRSEALRASTYGLKSIPA